MSNLKKELYEIIFEADTPMGKLFDIILLWAIILSITAVCLESVSSIRVQYGSILKFLEWTFTILFTVEYVLRLITVKKHVKYAFSFYGLVDLIAILPTYLSVLLPGAQTLLVVRALRLLRVFRILKLGHYVAEAQLLSRALSASRRKITVFLVGVLSTILIAATLMYLIEGPEHGFNSIPRSLYWAIVTITTVGYGDISPQTVLGQVLASIVMIVGYTIIAVPTGIVSAEMMKNTANQSKHTNTKSCRHCTRQGHDKDAKFCKFCGFEFS